MPSKSNFTWHPPFYKDFFISFHIPISMYTIFSCYTVSYVLQYVKLHNLIDQVKSAGKS